MAPHPSTLVWKIPWTEEPGPLNPPLLLMQSRALNSTPTEGASVAAAAGMAQRGTKGVCTPTHTGFSPREVQSTLSCENHYHLQLLSPRA